MTPCIVPIVEGHAEAEAVPLLLRRMLAASGPHETPIARPFRVKRTQVVRPGELERAVQHAAAARDNVGAVLVLLDADDDCPAELGPRLLARCKSAIALPVAVVLACREFEAWFLGAKESLRKVRGIAPTAQSPESPEAVRGAKERLSANMQRRRYVPVDDQAALAAEMSLADARRRCPSLDKLFREVRRLVSAMDAEPIQ